MKHTKEEKGKSLNDKQRTFCKEYIIDLNLTQAGIRAGYSPKTAYSIAEENLRKPEIQDYIQQLMKERSKRLEISADMVLNELAKIGFSDIKDYLYFSENAEVVFNEKSILDLSAVQEITTTTYSDTTNKSQNKIQLKFKLYDKLRALELLAKHLGLFDKTEQNDNEKVVVKIMYSEKTKEQEMEDLKFKKDFPNKN